MGRKGWEGDALSRPVWGKGEEDGTNDFSSAGVGSLDQGGRVAAVHQQMGYVLGFSPEILIPAAQASKAEELRIADGPF